MYNILNTSIYRYIIIYYYPLIALKDPYFCLNKLGGIRIIRLCEAPKFPYLFWGNQLKNITEFPQFLGTNPKKNTSSLNIENPVARSLPLTSSWSSASRTQPAHWPHSSPPRPVRLRILGSCVRPWRFFWGVGWSGWDGQFSRSEISVMGFLYGFPNFELNLLLLTWKHPRPGPNPRSHPGVPSRTWKRVPLGISKV